MDFRVTGDGQVYVLEANANPNLEAEEDFAESARAAGVAYDDLLGRLMTLGLSYQAEWRGGHGLGDGVENEAEGGGVSRGERGGERPQEGAGRPGGGWGGLVLAIH